jgi:RNA polymerase sigma-70 factor (ECF subfamily)
MGPHLRGKVELTDVLQETLLRSFNSVRRFEYRGEGSFLRWLCSVSEFVMRDYAKIFRSDRAATLDQDVPGKIVSPSKALRRDERFHRLGKAIEDLSPDYREVVTLVCLKRRSVKETAECMKRTPGAIRNLLRRALRDLKKSFGDTESLHLPLGSLDHGESGDED